MLGDSGGMGLISTVIDEIFTSLPNILEKQANSIGSFQRNTISAKLKTRDNITKDQKLIKNSHSNVPYITMQAVVLIGK